MITSLQLMRQRPGVESRSGSPCELHDLSALFEHFTPIGIDGGMTAAALKNSIMPPMLQIHFSPLSLSRGEKPGLRARLAVELF
jgi:hypothetical protein